VGCGWVGAETLGVRRQMAVSEQQLLLDYAVFIAFINYFWLLYSFFCLKILNWEKTYMQ